MILIAIGSNLTGPWGSPAETAAKAVGQLDSHAVTVTRTSRYYRTAAVGPGNQDSYVNLLVCVQTHLPPPALLRVLHGVEHAAGRTRGARWRARALDLDLVAYHQVILGWGRSRDLSEMADARSRLGQIVVPHPRLHLRPFVVRPLLDLAPMWHHPVTGESAANLWQKLQRRSEGRILTVIPTDT